MLIYGYHQELLVKLGLNNDDALLLRWFVESIEEGGYCRVDYQDVMDDLPILGINNRETAGRRFKRLVTSGVLKHRIDRDGGTFAAYRVNKIIYDGIVA